MRAAAVQPEGAFAFLLGAWEFEREVSGLAVMRGRLEVLATGSGDEAMYSECATVQLLESAPDSRGSVLKGRQRYLVRRRADGFELRFAGAGALFQEVRFRGMPGGMVEGEAEHLCVADRYLSRYRLGPGRVFTVRHAVTGPRKDYVSETSFFRRQGVAWPASGSGGRYAGRSA